MSSLRGLDQEMIEADLAELVDHHGRVGELGLAQQMLQQRRLAAAEKAGQDRDRQALGRASRVSLIRRRRRAGCGAPRASGVSSITAPAWCAAASGTGTTSSRVEMPRLTWMAAMPARRSSGRRALGRQSAAAQPQRQHRRRHDHGEPAVDELGGRGFSKGLRQTGSRARTSPGTSAAHQGKAVVDLAAIEPGGEAARGEHADDEDQQDQHMAAQRRRAGQRARLPGAGGRRRSTGLGRRSPGAKADGRPGGTGSRRCAPSARSRP